MEEKLSFSLLNVCLYAKNWYKKDGSIWDNLAKCLEADQFGPYDEPFKERAEITGLIIAKVRPFLKDHMISDLFSNISPQNCWRVGYTTIDHKQLLQNGQRVPTYEYWEAVVRAHLSCLALMTMADLGLEKLPTPSIPELLKNLQEQATL